MTNAAQQASYRFGSFVLDLTQGALLTADGKELPLRAKSFALLRLLAENAGRLLSQKAIMEALWPNLFVSDNNVTQCIHDIRTALGSEAHQILRTVPRRGYLFKADPVAVPLTGTFSKQDAVAEWYDSRAITTQTASCPADEQLVTDETYIEPSPLVSPPHPGRGIQDKSPSGIPSLRYRMTLAAEPSRTGPPRVAVLPFRHFHDTAIPSHLSDGLAADITCQLAGLRELTIISYGSTYSLRDPVMNLREIGQKLGAPYLVLGSIRRCGDRLRLTTELTEAESGQIVYTRTDNADAALSFAEQDRIVAHLVNALVPQVRETELRRIRGKRPNILSVYEKVLLAREYITLLNPGSFGEAKILLDEVIQEDPNYGEAYALAADWHGIRTGEGWSVDRAADVNAVEHLTQTALHLDTCNVRALVAYAYRRSRLHRDHDGAMNLFRRALDIAPSSAMAWALSSVCVAWANDAPEAVRRAERALELSPHDREAHKFYYALCVAYYTYGNYAEATKWGLRALSEKTVWQGTGGYTAASLVALGRHQDAREVANQTMQQAPGRQVHRIVANLPYSNAERRKLYGQHLLAAGFPN